MKPKLPLLSYEDVYHSLSSSDRGRLGDAAERIFRDIRLRTGDPRGDAIDILETNRILARYRLEVALLYALPSQPDNGPLLSDMRFVLGPLLRRLTIVPNLDYIVKPHTLCCVAANNLTASMDADEAHQEVINAILPVIHKHFTRAVPKENHVPQVPALRKYSITQLQALRLCSEYPRGRLERLARGREAVDVIEILKEEEVTFFDRYYVVVEKELLPPSETLTDEIVRRLYDVLHTLPGTAEQRIEKPGGTLREKLRFFSNLIMPHVRAHMVAGHDEPKLVAEQVSMLLIQQVLLPALQAVYPDAAGAVAAAPDAQGKQLLEDLGWRRADKGYGWVHERHGTQTFERATVLAALDLQRSSEACLDAIERLSTLKTGYVQTYESAHSALMCINRRIAAEREDRKKERDAAARKGLLAELEQFGAQHQDYTYREVPVWQMNKDQLRGLAVKLMKEAAQPA